MTKIVLRANEETADKLYGRNNVIITHDNYPLCNLFHKFKHRFISPKTSDIEIREDNIRGRRLTIKLNEPYKNKPLECVEVYFNKHDSKNEYPLILLLLFDDESKKVPNKYYRLSGIADEIGSSQEIATLRDYEKESDIHKALIEENDKTKILLTYQIDKRDTEKYNDDKIKLIKEDVKGENGDTSHKFTKYKHEPERQHTNKPSYFLFDMNLLMERSDNMPKAIDIENQKIFVTVYWSVNVNIPLLLEFDYNTERNIHHFEYYVTRNDENGIYFEKLSKETKEIKELLKDSRDDIYRALIKDNNKTLIELLEKLKTNLLEVLVIMIDKQDGYSKADIRKSFKDSSPYRLANSDTKISVEDLTTFNGKCLIDLGFKVIEHYFINTVDSTKLSKDIVLFKFIIPNEYNNRYSELRLYKTSRGIESEEILHCNVNHSKLTIYFIGHDPRPLLLCYGDSFYGPRNKSDYFTKWNKHENINTTVCHNDRENIELLEALAHAVGFLNTVQLHQKPLINILNDQSNSTSNIDATYIVHSFNSKNIKIRVSYFNKSCYRLYTHKPNGTDGKGNGYRLGNIKYELTDSGDNGLNYVIYEPLSEVSVLYNVYDYYHQYPLLVILKFGTSKLGYYKLINTNKPYKWEKMENTNINDVEALAYNIQIELQIEFSDNQKTKYLFDPKECKDSSSAAIAGTLSTLGLTALGTGFAYYKYPEVFERLYRRVIYLIQMRLTW